jgi:large subunit ribosomal protein L1
MHSKRYKAAKTLVEVGKTYPLTEAVALVKQTASTKFDGSIEIHIRLGIDPTKGDQAVRGTVELPHGSGKKVRVAVIAKGPAAKAAKDAGADIVGDDDLIAEIKSQNQK